MGDFDIDSREFNKAFDFVQQTVPRDASLVLNKGALTAIVGSRENKYAGSVRGAIERTPRADKSAIRALDPRIITAAVMKIARKKGENLTRDQITHRVRAEYNRRAKSSGYTAGPGWDKASRAFGGRGVKRQRGFEKSEAAHGSGNPSTPSRLIASLTNTAPAAEKKGFAALQAALNQTAGAMVEYGEKKLQQTFDKVNAR